MFASCFIDASPQQETHKPVTNGVPKKENGSIITELNGDSLKPKKPKDLNGIPVLNGKNKIINGTNKLVNGSKA